jgi:hypothetical protein
MGQRLAALEALALEDQQKQATGASVEMPVQP